MISRTGRYKVFPIVGTFVMTVGLLLLSRLGAGSSIWTAAAYMLVVGRRDRDGHAGARARRPELGRPPADGRRDVRVAPVPADRRVDRDRPVRRDLREPPGGEPRRAAARRAAPDAPRAPTVDPAPARRRSTTPTSRRSPTRSGRSSWSAPASASSPSGSPGSCARCRCARRPARGRPPARRSASRRRA